MVLARFRLERPSFLEKGGGLLVNANTPGKAEFRLSGSPYGGLRIPSSVLLRRSIPANYFTYGQEPHITQEKMGS